MKRKYVYLSVCIIFLISICIIALSFTKIKFIFTREIPIEDMNKFKQASITLKDVPKNKFNNLINKTKAVDAANAYCGDLYKRTKVYAQLNLLTDDHIGIDAINTEAVNADPILQYKNKVDEIPVWIVCYKYPAWRDVFVIVDAISGKILYSVQVGGHY